MTVTQALILPIWSLYLQNQKVYLHTKFSLEAWQSKTKAAFRVFTSQRCQRSSKVWRQWVCDPVLTSSPSAAEQGCSPPRCGGHRDLKDSSDPYMSDILSQQAMLLFSFSFRFPLQVQPSHPPLNLRPLSTAPQWLLCPSAAFTADSLCFTYQPQISDFLWLLRVCVCAVYPHSNINTIIRYEPCKFALWIREAAGSEWLKWRMKCTLLREGLWC